MKDKTFLKLFGIIIFTELFSLAIFDKSLRSYNMLPIAVSSAGLAGTLFYVIDGWVNSIVDAIKGVSKTTEPKKEG